MNNRSRLKILKASCIYGGVFSLVLVGLYVLFLVSFPGTVRYMPIQVTLLLVGIVSATVFSYMHLNYAREDPDEFSCSILSGIVITAICLISGLIFIIPPLSGVCYGDLESVVYMTIFSTPGYISLILGILSAYAVLSGSRKSPEGIERWKIRGLQLSTVILITGLVVSGISISTGFIGKTEMKYEVMLDTSEETTFFVPVPVDTSNNVTADIIDELTVVEGTADWDIVDTEAGKALEVHTSTKCILSAKKECGYMDRDEIKEWLQRCNLSMIYEMHERDSDGWKDCAVWVFASNTNTTIRMRLTMYTGLGATRGYLTDDHEILLEEGWQTVELNQHRMCYD